MSFVAYSFLKIKSSQANQSSDSFSMSKLLRLNIKIMKSLSRIKSFTALIITFVIIFPRLLSAFEAQLPRYYFHYDKLNGIVSAKGTLLGGSEEKGAVSLPQERINSYSLRCLKEKKSCQILRYFLQENGVLSPPEEQSNYLIIQQWSDSLILAKEEWHEGACYLLTIRFEPLLEAVKFVYDSTNNKNRNCRDISNAYSQKLLFNLSEPPQK